MKAVGAGEAPGRPLPSAQCPSYSGATPAPPGCGGASRQPERCPEPLLYLQYGERGNSRLTVQRSKAGLLQFQEERKMGSGALMPSDGQFEAGGLGRMASRCGTGESCAPVGGSHASFLLASLGFS